MGGKNSSFTMSNGTDFQWQHDARWRGKSRISLFDNAATHGEMDAEYSRGLLLELDTESMVVNLVTEYIPYNRTASVSQGNVQILDNDTGAAVIGWGFQPWFSQHTGDGQIQWAVQFGVVNVQACRSSLASSIMSTDMLTFRSGLPFQLDRYPVSSPLYQRF